MQTTVPSPGGCVRRSSRGLARLPVLRRPAGWGKGERPQDFWTDLSGVTATWSNARTLELVADYPADYPTAIEDPAVDAKVRELFEGASPKIDVTWLMKSRGRRLQVRFDRLARMPTLPLLMELEVWSADGSKRLATEPAVQIRGYATRLDTWGFGAALDEGVEPAALTEASTLRLRLKGTRAAALTEKSVESYWAGSFELTVPVITTE